MTTKEIQDSTFCYDIETFKACFLLGCKKIGEEQWFWFEISEYRNDLDAMVKWLLEHPKSHLAGFNNISFDMQVLQYILDESEKWYDKTPMQIVRMIAEFAQEIISNQDYDIKPPYREAYLDIPQIDLGRIHNFFNEQKRVSLKWVEFMTDQIVDEMPFDHTEPYLTREQVEMVREYCEHDIRATETLWFYTTGECDNKLYKGKNKIQENLDTIERFKLPKECLSYSSVKLGEEIILKGYLERSKGKRSDLYKKKKERKRKHFTFGDCIPKYVKFKSKELKELREKVNDVQVNLSDKKQEFPFKYQSNQYKSGKGGIHTKDQACIIIPTDEWELIEIDCSSQYPISILRKKTFPSHLGIEWFYNADDITTLRLLAKEEGKKDVKQKGIAERLKDAINGGMFGKTGDYRSLQYDPWVHFQCTIGNQYEILMLVEWLYDIGVTVLSANTDGCLCKVPKSKKEEFYNLCKKWEEYVGITAIGKGDLEYTHYIKYIASTVNDYMAIKTDGSLKQKGDFSVDFLLEKNKSRRIIPIALENWFVRGIRPEETVRNHRNIFDFRIAVKASNKYYYQGVDRKTGIVNKYKKMVTYYCSTVGEKLWKIAVEGGEGKVEKSQCESKSNCQTIFNKPFTVDNWEDYNIDYEYYENKVWEMILKLQPELKPEYKRKKTHQGSLF